MSFNFLKDQVNLGDLCTLVQEQNNLVDKYGRHLGYLILDDGRVLNEIMIKEGYAKPYNDVFLNICWILLEDTVKISVYNDSLYNDILL